MSSGFLDYDFVLKKIKIIKMKTNNVFLANSKGQLSYESPRVCMLQVELEHSIAAASINGETNNSIKESWGTETQEHEVEW